MKAAVKFFIVATCVAQAVLVFAARKGTIDWANRPDSPTAKIKGYLPVSAPEAQGVNGIGIGADDQEIVRNGTNLIVIGVGDA